MTKHWTEKADQEGSMHLMLTCPNDGDVRVTIEDVASVFMREPGTVEVVFECPACGDPIGVSAAVPAILAAALEALGERDGDRRLAGFVVAVQEDEVFAEALGPRVEPIEADAYCEYFRRELESVTCVEDALAEIDGR